MISIYTAICAALLATVLFSKAASQDWVEHLRSSRLHPANAGTTAPQIGGLIIIPACLMVAGIAWFMTGNIFSEYDIVIFAGTAILCLTGFIDDRKKLSIKPRLVVQTLVSSMLCLSLLPTFLAQLGDFYPSYHAIFSGAFLIIAVLVIIWSINSLNFMDGADLALVSNILPGTLLIGLLIPYMWNDTVLPLIAASLFGGLVVFSFYNWPPAKFYLGDARSLPIGFVVGAIMLTGITRDLSFSALIPFTYVFVDTTLTFVKRMLSGKTC